MVKVEDEAKFGSNSLQNPIHSTEKMATNTFTCDFWPTKSLKITNKNV